LLGYPSQYYVLSSYVALRLGLHRVFSTANLLMPSHISAYEVTWAQVPDDYLPSEHHTVDGVTRSLATALTESLELTRKLPAQALATANLGICATVNGNIMVKTPDWVYVPAMRLAREEMHSYTPKIQGDLPLVVAEFLSETEAGEYSIKPSYPLGKWIFYEQILQVPNYIIFDPAVGTVEVYQLDKTGRYKLRQPDANNRYWIARLGLSLGVWQGSRESYTGYWLRWWDEMGNLLPWQIETVQQSLPDQPFRYNSLFDHYQVAYAKPYGQGVVV
jgi:Uma2 family endonuclease